MTSFSSAVARRTLQPYRHYRRRIVVRLAADLIELRLEGTRKRLTIPVSALMDTLYRWEALADMREKRAHKKLRIKRLR